MSMDFFLIRKSVSLRVLSKKMNPFNYQFPRQAAVKCAGCLGQKKKKVMKSEKELFFIFSFRFHVVTRKGKLHP